MPPLLFAPPPALNDLTRLDGGPQQWHGYVHDDHGRTEFPGHRHRLPSVFRFAYDFEIRLGPQQGPKPRKDEGMVIREQDRDLFHLVRHRSVLFPPLSMG